MDKPKSSAPIPLPVVLIGGVFMSATGGVLAAALMGYIPLAPSSVKVPYYVLWAATLVFLCGGLAMLLSRLAKRLAGWLTLAAMLCFVFIFNWIAFGPGERAFSTHSRMGSGSVAMSHSTPASETEGRIVFGLFAGAMDALIVYAVIYSLRHRRDDS